MQTANVVPLTEKAVSKLLRSREAARPKNRAAGKRLTPRWPFPGVVELWLPDDNGDMQHVLATSVNLSLNGLGIRSDEPLEPGTEVELAFHEPEMSFHGRATVRHTTKMESDHLMGLQFIFDKK